MKVLFAHNYYQQPGGEDVVFAQEQQLLKDHGHEVVAYTRDNDEVEKFGGIRRFDLVKQVIWAPDSHDQIHQLLRREKPDIVHFHNTFFMISPSVYSACRKAGVPVVQTLHNYRLMCPAATFFREGNVCEECAEHSLWRGVRHACYHDSRLATGTVALMIAANRRRRTWVDEVDCFIALTEFARNKFVEGGLPEKKVHVKPNFVHPDPGARSCDGDYALFVGRLSSEKGVKTLLEAWKLLSMPIPLEVVGGGPQFEELNALAARLGLSNVRFRGPVPREQALAAINGARFLLFPSVWYESFPMTIAEAFACKTPVICSRLGSMAEIVEDGRTGLHFAPRDPADLARKAEWAWTHPEQVRAMGLEARREYETKYTAAKGYPLLMDIYRDVIARRAKVN